jgi:hypothetical protein
MTFRVIWNWPALAMFYKLPMHSAFMVDRAVVRFAETGTGHIEWVAPHHRLRAGFYDAVLAVDREARTITVLRIYRARP